MNSLRSRLMLAVMPVALLGVIATVVVGARTATTSERTSATAGNTQLALNAAARIDTFGQTVQQAAVSISAVAEGFRGDDRTVLMSQVRRAAARTDGVLDTYVAYEAGKAPGRDADWKGRPGNTESGRFIATYMRSDEQDRSQPPGVRSTSLYALDDGYLNDSAELDWYHGPKTTGRVTVTEPFLDSGTKVLMTSFTAPIRSRSGAFAGVGGVDVPLDSLSKEISRLRVGRSGYAVLVSAQGIVLGAPSAKGGTPAVIGVKKLVDVVRPAQRAEVTAALAASGRSAGTRAGRDPFSGEEGLLSWARVPSTGWSVLAFRPMSEVDAPAVAVRNRLALTGLLTLLLVGGMVGFLAHRLTRPLPVLRSAALRIADGDLDVDLPPPGRDEMGQLSAAFSAMVAYLRRASEHAGRIATGDLATTLAPASGGDVLGHALEDMRTGLADSVGTLVGNATSLNGSAQELRAQAENLRTRAAVSSRQSRAAADGTATFDAGLSQIAGSTQDCTRLTAEVTEATDVMNAQLLQLRDSSSAIAEVLGVITSIADQTQLLALNATIESARAGEVGKGFAVVADEVKQLANSTTKATVRVSERITAIQDAVGTTVDLIAAITQRVVAIGEAGSAISAAVDEQSVSSAAVGRNVQEVARAAEQTDHDVAGALDVSERLAATARDLQGVVERFQLTRA